MVDNGKIVGQVSRRDVLRAIQKISKHELYQKQFFTDVVETNNYDEVAKYFESIKNLDFENQSRKNIDWI